MINNIFCPTAENNNQFQQEGDTIHTPKDSTKYAGCLKKHVYLNKFDTFQVKLVTLDEGHRKVRFSIATTH